MAAEKNFEYLGQSFQLQLLNQIVVDKEFAHSIVDVIEPNYFENKYFKIIIQMIKEYHSKYEVTPSFETLNQITRSELPQEMVAKVVLDTVKKIKDVEIEGTQFVQEKALKFCKQQEVSKAMTKAQKIIDGGEFESYDTIEELFKTALQVGERETSLMDVFSNLDEVLNEDYRHPIPMGIPGIDRLLKGGLAKGEIGVILAPTGVGKSTLLTKISNHAFNLGYNVLQIFFEDNPKIIQRKHIVLWTGIHPDDLEIKKQEVIKKVREVEGTMNNKLILQKYASDTLSMNQIKNSIRKLIADGQQIDMVLLDYIDCVLPDRQLEDEWKSEGSVMRGFEAMCHELSLVGWTATQGNRCCSLDTIVDVKNKGLIQIKDVVLGDKILTHKGYKDITHIFPIQKQSVYKIKTKSGKEIKVSANHEFPIGKKLMSISTGLSVGDKLYLKK